MRIRLSGSCFSALSGVLLASALALSGCDPKPLADLPSMKDDKPVDTRDRALPSGKTLAASLPLLDPRAMEIPALERQRNEFLQKLITLVPDKAERERLGFSRVLRWHTRYTRRLQTQQRLVKGQRDALARLLMPKKGQWLYVDDRGAARMCKKQDAPAGADTPPTETCTPVAGFMQLEQGSSHLNDGLKALVEAEWYLMVHLERLRATLDPGANELPAEPTP